MNERLRNLGRELSVRLRRVTVDLSPQDWETIQSGIFGLNGAAAIGESLARNSVAAVYAPEIAIGNVMSVAVFRQEELQKINGVLNRTQVVQFMEIRKGSDNQYGLFPKPEYEGRVSIRETADENGALQNVRIDLKRKL